MELRSKYMNDLDMAFRLGFEQGQQQAAQDQMMQAEAQRQQMELAAAQGQPQPGQESSGQEPGQEEQAPGQESPEGQGQPSELDQHISKLESMIAKSEDNELKKGLQDLVSLRKAEIQAIQIKKGDQAVKGIVKALHKPKFKMSVQASHNLGSNAKQAVSMQQKIVTDILQKMEVEEKRANTDIKALLAQEGLTKKD